MSKAMDEAKASLPPRLHSQLEAMCEEYKFACLKHHGFEMVSPKVIAELILNRWASIPLFVQSSVACNAAAAAAAPILMNTVTMCTCGFQQGEESYCKRTPCGLRSEVK